MTLRDLLVPLILALVTPAAPAGESEATTPNAPRHLIGFSTGLTRGAVRDEIMSPLMYSGVHAPLQLTYLYRGPVTRHTILLSYSAGDLTSSITNTPTAAHLVTSHHAAISYAWATTVMTLEECNTSCFAGVALTGLLNLRQHHFTKGQSHTNAEQMFGLGISLSTETSLAQGSPNILRCEIGMPCISYALLTDHYNANVTTTIYAQGADTDVWSIFRRGRFVWPGSLFDLRASVAYLMYITDHVGIDMQYHIRYYTYPEYEDLFRARVLTHQLLLGITVAL